MFQARSVVGGDDSPQKDTKALHEHKFKYDQKTGQFLFDQSVQLSPKDEFFSTITKDNLIKFVLLNKVKVAKMQPKEVEFREQFLNQSARMVVISQKNEELLKE